MILFESTCEAQITQRNGTMRISSSFCNWKILYSFWMLQSNF